MPADAPSRTARCAGRRASVIAPPSCSPPGVDPLVVVRVAVAVAMARTAEAARIDFSSAASFFFAASRSLASCAACSVSDPIRSWAAARAADSSSAWVVRRGETIDEVRRTRLLIGQAGLQRLGRDRRDRERCRLGGPRGRRADRAEPEQERGDCDDHGEGATDRRVDVTLMARQPPVSVW